MIRRLIILLLIVGCVPITFSNLQSAKMLEKGKFEFTPSVTKNIVTYNYGIQTAYGLNRKSNLRFRLERIGDGFSTHLSFGLKKSLKYNKSAIYLPISFTKLDGSTNILKLIEPTYIHTFTLGKYFEINPSIKALFNISSENKDGGFLLVYNLGFGFSSNLTKWVIRSEVGILAQYPPDETKFPHISVGLSIYP